MSLTSSLKAKKTTHYKEVKKKGDRKGDVTVRATWQYAGKIIDVGCAVPSELLSKAEQEYQSAPDTAVKREARKALRIHYDQVLKVKQIEEGRARDLVQRMTNYFDSMRTSAIITAALMFYFAANKPPDFQTIPYELYSPETRRYIFGGSVALCFFCSVFALLFSSLFSSYINYLGANGITWFTQRYDRLLDLPEVLSTLSLIFLIISFVNSMSAYFSLQYLQYVVLFLLILLFVYFMIFAVVHRGVTLRMREIILTAGKDKDTESLVYLNLNANPMDNATLNPPTTPTRQVSSRTTTPTPPTTTAGGRGAGGGEQSVGVDTLNRQPQIRVPCAPDAKKSS